METSQLIIKDDIVGSGVEAKAGDDVTVHYVGALTDGTVFDASRKHGDSGFTFTLGAGQVIKGWDEGVPLMSVGEKAKLIISQDYAYGERGHPGVIPPKADLIFDVELISIN